MLSVSDRNDATASIAKQSSDIALQRHCLIDFPVRELTGYNRKPASTNEH